MNKFSRLAVAALVACAANLALAEEAGESGDTTVTQEQLPQKTADTVKEYGEGGEFDHAVKADEDGVAVYEVTVKKGDRKIEVQTTLDGELNMREETIDASELPKAAAARAMKATPGGKITGAERTLRSVYEIQMVDAKGKKTEVLVTPGGQLATEPEELDAAEGAKKGEKDEEDEKDEKPAQKKGSKKSEGKEKD